MNEYINPSYILAQTGTRRHVIMMYFGNRIHFDDYPDVCWLVVQVDNGPLVSCWRPTVYR